MQRKGIALLTTLMFVIVITVSLGYALTQVNNASDLVKEEKFLYQTSFLVEDILKILNNSSQIQEIVDNNSSEGLAILLAQSMFIPLKLEETKLILKISSARSRYNPSEFTSENMPIMKQYLNVKMVNSQYGDILFDVISGIKDDNSYNSRIFDDNPTLFRDYIVSSKHLKKVNDFYAREYNDDALKNINFEQLFYYTNDKNISIDLNYASQEVWEMCTGVSEERANDLQLNGFGAYTSLEDLGLNSIELEKLSKFKTSFFEPILLIELLIKKDNNKANISFEYDIKQKKGSNFVYEI